MRLLIINSMFFFTLQSAAAITVEDILRNNEEAMGGADAISAVETVLTVSRLSTGGFEGIDTVASMRPDRFYEDIDLGILRQISITDGDGYWSSDQSGQTRLAAGMERDLLEMASYFANFRYLNPRDGEAELTDEDDSGYIITYTVIEDFPVEVSFDKATWLIARTEVNTDFGRSITEYSDYHEVSGGINLPHKITQTTGPQTIISEVSEVYVNERVTPDDFVPPQLREGDVRLTGETKDIPIEVSGNLIFVNASLDGSLPLKFMLDTGAGMTVVDYNVIDVTALDGGEIPAMGVGGMEQTSLMMAQSLGVGGAELLGPTVAVMDLSGVSGAIGEDIAGILGYGFIGRFTLEIDYGNETLTIYNPDDFVPSEETVFLPIEFVSNIPLVEAAVDGYEGKFVLDSGNGVAVILHGPYVQENLILESYGDKAAASVSGLGGKERVYSVCMDQLNLGGFYLSKPVVLLSTADTAGFAMTSAIGNIGGEVLSRFTVYLDYPNNRIGLVPNAKFDEPFPFEYSK
ncbi:MAG: hypothetical protein GY771_10365 [bacterium]|nr:hypothetical protein [bacterium]